VQLFYQIALLGRRDLALAPDEQSGFTMTMLRMLAFKEKTQSVAVNGGAEKTPVTAPRKAAAPAPASAQGSAGSSEPPPWNTAPDKVIQADAVKMPANAGVSGDAVSGFEGSWPNFVSGLNLSGMASMLAKQVEFRSLNGGVLELGLADAHKHLADKAYQEKLKVALVPHFGANLRINIKIGEVAGASLAAVEDRARSVEQAAAEAAIDSDPFIKNLQQDFGAEVNRASIRPANS
jgi:DNA polymerase III subunit gamma/tau